MQQINFREFQNKVFDFAVKKKMLKHVSKIDVQIKMDFIMELVMHGKIPKRQSFVPDEVISSDFPMFLDWYFFEREYENKKTIGELYAESEKLEDLKEEIKKLRNPIWDAFIVIKKEEKDEYLVKLFDKKDTFLIHDKATFQIVNVNDVFVGKIYQFFGKCYISSSITSIPKDIVDGFNKTKEFCKNLEEKFNEFMKEKENLSEKTKWKYEDMFSLLLDYVREKNYNKIEQIKKLNIDNFIKWNRKRFLNYSRNNEDENRTAIRGFLKYLEKS